MGLRASVTDVQGVIQVRSGFDVNIHIRQASALVDKVAAADSDGELSSEDLWSIEVTLAAGFYAEKDGQYASKKTMDASASFQTGQRGLGPFEANDWLTRAMALDTTGYLAKLNEQAKTGGKKEASAKWIGLEPSAQTDYRDRD